MVSAQLGILWSPLVLRSCAGSQLLALPAIGVDFAHELGIRGNKVIPRCADLLRAAEVSWVEEGDDSLSNMGYSSQVHRTQDVPVCWRGGGKTLRCRSWRQQGEGRKDSRRIDRRLRGGRRHEDGGLLWCHDFFHFHSKLLNDG